MPPKKTAMSTVRGSRRSLQGRLDSSPRAMVSISTGSSAPVISRTASVSTTGMTARFLARLSPQTYALSRMVPVSRVASKSSGRTMPISTEPLAVAALKSASLS
ncbi:hypothetical protein ES708_13915 [subsurface metagenome]